MKIYYIKLFIIIGVVSFLYFLTPILESHFDIFQRLNIDIYDYSFFDFTIICFTATNWVFKTPFIPILLQIALFIIVWFSVYFLAQKTISVINSSKKR